MQPEPGLKDFRGGFSKQSKMAKGALKGESALTRVQANGAILSPNAVSHKLRTSVSSLPS